MRFKNRIGIFILVMSIGNGLAFNIPLNFHGRAFIGKYLNSDTSRYNMDGSVALYCKVIEHKTLSWFIKYRDDLDMARQTGGVSLDPRYAHYYVITGFDLMRTTYFMRVSFMHDCVHDIDYEVEGTPVFNRFSFQLAHIDYHPTRYLITTKTFLWNIKLTAYPHWHYHGWDINAGADYQYGITLDGLGTIFSNDKIVFTFDPQFTVIRGDSSYYHSHQAKLTVYYTNKKAHIGTQLLYNIWNNNPIKAPDKLWLLSVFIDF